MKPRPELLALAQACGATLTGKPDGSEAVTVNFSVTAWREFDSRLLAKAPAGAFEMQPTEYGPLEDQIAWILCQIIDDDAPLRWTRYRFVAECVAHNRRLLNLFEELAARRRR